MMSAFRRLLAVALLITGCADHSYFRADDRVHLRLRDADAREVLFSASLAGFERQAAQKRDEKTWEVVAPDREFTYFYIVDGNVHRPDCRYREVDDFGSYNCLYRPGL